MFVLFFYVKIHAPVAVSWVKLVISATLRAIRRLFVAERTPFHKLVERAETECSTIRDVEIISRAAEAREAGDAARAAALLTVAAERRNPEAEFRLGKMFVDGDVPTDRFPQGELSYRRQSAGVRWLMAAAQAGHSMAEARLKAVTAVDSSPSERERAAPRREREEG